MPERPRVPRRPRPITTTAALGLAALAATAATAAPAPAATWTPADPITTEAGADLQLVTLAPGGRALIVLSKDGRGYLQERETYGAAFGPVQALPGVTHLSEPDAAIGTDGSAVLVWNAAAAGAAPRHMFAVRPAGGTWSAPKRLRLLDGSTNPAVLGPGYRLGIDDQGRAELLTGVYTANGHVAVRLLRQIGGKWRNQGPQTTLGRPRTDGTSILADIALDLDGHGAAAAAVPVTGGWMVATRNGAAGWALKTLESPPSESTEVTVDGDDVALTGASCVSPAQLTSGERTAGELSLAVRSNGVWRQETLPSTGYAPCTGTPALWKGGLLVGWTALRAADVGASEEVFAVRWNAGAAPVARSLTPTAEDLHVRAPVAVPAGGEGLLVWWQWAGVTPAPTLQGAAGLFGDASLPEDIPGQAGTLLTAADVADDGSGIVVEHRADGTLAVLSRAPGGYGY